MILIMNAAKWVLNRFLEFGPIHRNNHKSFLKAQSVGLRGLIEREGGVFQTRRKSARLFNASYFCLVTLSSQQ